ncbi:MAG: hypothetical protein WBQ29_17555 [Isosphaeraceae bacterium]
MLIASSVRAVYYPAQTLRYYVRDSRRLLEEHSRWALIPLP